MKKKIVSSVLIIAMLSILIPNYAMGTATAFAAGSMSVSDSGIALIKDLEGFRSSAYKALSTEKYYTIGYGHYGADVYAEMTITQQQGEQMLRQDLPKYEGYVNTFLNNHNITVSQNQFDALTSFTYNLGNVWVSTETFQLKTYLINGISNYSREQITTAFTNWNKSGGNVIDGLTVRRQREAAVFLTADSGGTAHTVDEAMAWCESKLDKKVGSGQCVAFVQEYYSYLGATPPGCDAKQFATEPTAKPIGWSRVQGGIPQRGDILVYIGANFGHVAIYAGGTVSYHQNMPEEKVSKKTDWNYDKSWFSENENGRKSYWGYIRPDFGSISHTIDTQYETNFSATAKAKQYAQDEYHNTLSNHWIDAGDKCVIHEVYTDGCCKVTYPSDNSTETYYFNISNFEWETMIPDDIGTDFYAFIAHKNTRRYLTNDTGNNHNVCSREKDGSRRQIWKFERRDDGTYKIINQYDQTCLDVYGGYSENGTNVQTHESNDADAQRWQVYGSLDSCKLSAVCTRCYLDLYNGSVENGANIQMWEGNESGAQAFRIEKAGNIWLYNSIGWWYFNADGTFPVNQWKEIDGKWYYFSSDGYMQTGWVKVGDYWYYLDGSGAMLTGWQIINGKWYYFSASGAMLTGWQTINGKWYYLNENGAMQTGWLKYKPQGSDSEYWYYLDSSGAMVENRWVELDNKWYYIGEDGIMQSDRWIQYDGTWYYLCESGKIITDQWIEWNGTWYYLNSEGAMQTGWLKKNDKWYYLDSDGAMKTGWLEWNGNWYYFNNSGAMQTGWLTLEGKSYYLRDDSEGNLGKRYSGWLLWDNHWYYFNEDGVMQTGWLEYKEKRYYLNENGIMLTGLSTINGKTYYFSDSGSLQTGLIALGEKTYYFTESGEAYTGWLNYKGNRYYFDSEGIMVENPTHTVTYNANGGKGAPDAQIKSYGEDLTLSSTEPIRDNYTFLGWSEDKNAVTATYSAGDSFTKEANTILYAVWKQITLNSISVKTKPTKLTYTVGETLATSGLKLTANYSDGSTKEITSGFTCSPTTMNTAGTQKITVTYNGKTATFDVTVNAAPVIINSPSNVTSQTGESVSFTVKAQGEELTYQWYYKKSGSSTWNKWNSHTTATITAIANATWDGMQVYCKVTDKYGNFVDSKAATITITQSLQITSQPTGKTINLGDSLTLSLKAEGTGLTYQWYFKKTTQTSFNVWKGHTHASETCTPNATWHGIQLYCIVKDSAGNSVQSETVEITVMQALKITAQPTDKTITLGDPVTLSLKATGSGLTYQWYFKKTAQTSFNLWKGHTKATETCTPNATWNGIQLYCIVKDNAGNTEQSNTVTVRVNSAGITITQQPQNQSIIAGKPLTLTLKATGSSLKYQWYFKKKGQTSFNVWNGRTHATETVSPNNTWDGIQLYCKITDGSSNTLNSDTVTVSVLSVTTQPSNVTVAAGSNATFKVVATGSGLKYQWQYKKSGATSWSNWNGRTTASTTATANATWQGMQVRCIVTDGAGNKVTSSTATITIK